MKTNSRRVMVIFDPSYGEKLLELSQRAHVWVIESPSNQKAAEQYLKELKGRSVSEEEKKLALTLFSRSKLDADFLETLDEHHGEYASFPPWNELEVIGQSLDVTAKEALKEAAFDVVSITQDGFTALRTTSGT